MKCWIVFNRGGTSDRWLNEKVKASKVGGERRKATGEEVSTQYDSFLIGFYLTLAFPLVMILVFALWPSNYILW